MVPEVCIDERSQQCCVVCAIILFFRYSLYYAHIINRNLKVWIKSLVLFIVGNLSLVIKKNSGSDVCLGSSKRAAPHLKVTSNLFWLIFLAYFYVWGCNKKKGDGVIKSNSGGGRLSLCFYLNFSLKIIMLRIFHLNLLFKIIIQTSSKVRL